MPRFEVDYRGEHRIPLHVPDNATVQQMKELIAPHARVHPTELQLIYAGKTLRWRLSRSTRALPNTTILGRNLEDNNEHVSEFFHDIPGERVIHAEYSELFV